MDRFEEIRSKPEWDIEDEKWCVEEIERVRKERKWLFNNLVRSYWTKEKKNNKIFTVEEIEGFINGTMQQALKEAPNV